MPCASSSIAVRATVSSLRSCPRWTPSAPWLCRPRRSMLIGPSWPSKRLAAVTNLTGLTGTCSAWDLLGTALSSPLWLSGFLSLRRRSASDPSPENSRTSYYSSVSLVGRPRKFIWTSKVKLPSDPVAGVDELVKRQGQHAGVARGPLRRADRGGRADDHGEHGRRAGGGAWRPPGAA